METEKTNSLALEAQTLGRVTDALWTSVENLCWKVMLRKGVSREHIMGLAGEATHAALQSWKPELGDFGIHLWYKCSNLASAHRCREGDVISMSTSPYAKDRVLDVVRPDGFGYTEDTDTATDFYGSCSFENELEASIDAKVLLEYVTQEERDLLERVYVDGEKMSDIAMERGVCRNTVFNQVAKIKDKIKSGDNKNNFKNKLL